MEPLYGRIGRERADLFSVACATDRAQQVARVVTELVLGICRCAVATALMRLEPFAVMALVETLRVGCRGVALRDLGVEGRPAGNVAMHTTVETLLDPAAAQALGFEPELADAA